MEKEKEVLETVVSKNFIEQEIDKDLAEGVYDHVQTRFPPEPNGDLHIGNANSIQSRSESIGEILLLRERKVPTATAVWKRICACLRK